jgi:hypothetical protein
LENPAESLLPPAARGSLQLEAAPGETSTEVVEVEDVDDDDDGESMD